VYDLTRRDRNIFALAAVGVGLLVLAMASVATLYLGIRLGVLAPHGALKDEWRVDILRAAILGSLGLSFLVGRYSYYRFRRAALAKDAA
jgi:hypothetical protein